MNYKTLLSGTGGIQAFLSAESISANEALSVSLFSLDILAAYTIEGKQAPKEILKCLADFGEVFLKDAPNSDLIKAVIRNYPKKPPSSHEEIVNPTSISEYFKYEVIFNENAAHPSEINPCEELIIALSTRDLFSSIYWIRAALFTKQEMSESERLAIEQAINYITTTADSMNDAKLKWWLRMAPLTSIGGEK